MSKFKSKTNLVYKNYFYLLPDLADVSQKKGL